MIELFKNVRIDWLGMKKPFIAITILLLLIGAAAVELRGFNLGVDFTGGTLMTVRFKEPPALDRVRAALAATGIDAGKITLQPDLTQPNELLIRAPQSGTEFRDRIVMVRALQRLNPEGEVAGDRININVINPEAIEEELRFADPLGLGTRVFAGAHPYRQIADQVMVFRNSQPDGFMQNIEAINELPLEVQGLENFDADAARRALIERFYAGKIDLNQASTTDIEDAFNRIDPLGLAGQANAETVYREAAEAIRDYKTGRSGVIENIQEIQVQQVSADLLAKMEPYFTTGAFAVISADVVGPQVGEELRNRAIYVTLAALAGMLVYIAFRFEWVYGVAAVVAVLHDVLVTLGFFSLLGREINLTVVAALLTLVGYSMNDTIVIFDRIRENRRLRRRDPLGMIVNSSINETLSRTIITSGTTFVSVFAIVLFGGEVLRNFALALTFGVIVGSYSTFAIASPIMMWWQYLTLGKGGRRKLAESKARVAQQNVAKV